MFRVIGPSRHRAARSGVPGSGACFAVRPTDAWCGGITVEPAWPPDSILVVGGSRLRRPPPRRPADRWPATASSCRRAAARVHVISSAADVEVLEADISDPATLDAAHAACRRRDQSRRYPQRSGCGERSSARTSSLHAELVAACKAGGVARLLQMSALQRRPGGPQPAICAARARPKHGSTASGLDWTIFQPSVIFGREDSFLNPFANLSRTTAGAGARLANARFQPVYVGDVAHCFVDALTRCETIGRRYPLCGPKVYTLHELVRYVGDDRRCPAPGADARAPRCRSCRPSRSSICRAN